MKPFLLVPWDRDVGVIGRVNKHTRALPESVWLQIWKAWRKGLALSVTLCTHVAGTWFSESSVPIQSSIWDSLWGFYGRDFGTYLSERWKLIKKEDSQKVLNLYPCLCSTTTRGWTMLISCLLPDPVKIPAVRTLIKKSIWRRKHQIRPRYSCPLIQCFLSRLPLDIQYIILDLLDYNDIFNMQQALEWPVGDSYWRSRVPKILFFELEDVEEEGLDWEYLCPRLEQLLASFDPLKNRQRIMRVLQGTKNIFLRNLREEGMINAGWEARKFSFTVSYVKDHSCPRRNDAWDHYIPSPCHIRVPYTSTSFS